MRAFVFVSALALLASLTLNAQQASSDSSQNQQPQPVSGTPGQPSATLPMHQETMVVTGTYEPLPLNEVDRSVSIIDINGSPELYGNFANLLQSDASIDLEQRGPRGVQGDLSIRGSSFAQNLVLVNGFRVNDVQSAHHDLDLPLPMLAIDRVEVLRGAGSTYYGSDAIGGAVNFITAKPSRTELRVGSEGGNFGTNDQDAEFSYAAKRFGERLALERDFSSGFIPDRDYRILSGSSDTSFKTRLGETRLLLLSSDRAFGADQFYGPFDSWERTKGWFTGVTQDLGSAMQAAFSYRRHTDNFILFRDRPSVYANEHLSQNWDAALRRKDELKKTLTLFSGVEGYHESIDSNNLGLHARNHGAAYLDLDVRALRRFSLSAGLREELYGSLRAVASPTFSGGMWLGGGFKLRASASRAFHLPDYTELYYSQPGLFGNPDLLPETAWNYEAGLTWSRGRFRSDAAVFHRREHNVIDYVRASSTDNWVAENIQQLNFTGVELSQQIRLATWQQQLQASYTWLRGTRASLDGLLSRYAFNYPVHHVVADWYAVTPLHVTVHTRVGALERYNQDPYGIWDFGVSRSFGYVIAHMNLANITDTQYHEIAGVIMPGRSVVAGLEFVFPKLSR